MGDDVRGRALEQALSGMTAGPMPLHAIVAADVDVPGVLAASVAAVPPVVLLAITHLTVILTRTTHSQTGESHSKPSWVSFRSAD